MIEATTLMVSSLCKALIILRTSCLALYHRSFADHQRRRSARSETAHGAVATNCADPKLHDHHRFPTRLERVMFSMSVSVGRAKANATASATCVALIMRSRGHLPSTWLQISVSVAAG